MGVPGGAAAPRACTACPGYRAGHASCTSSCSPSRAAAAASVLATAAAPCRPACRDAGACERVELCNGMDCMLTSKPCPTLHIPGAACRAGGAPGAGGRRRTRRRRKATPGTRIATGAAVEASSKGSSGDGGGSRRASRPPQVAAAGKSPPAPPHPFCPLLLLTCNASPSIFAFAGPSCSRGSARSGRCSHCGARAGCARDAAVEGYRKDSHGGRRRGPLGAPAPPLRARDSSPRREPPR